MSTFSSSLLILLNLVFVTSTYGLDSIQFDIGPGSDVYGAMGRVQGAGTVTLTTLNVAPDHYITDVTLIPDPTVLWGPSIQGVECDPGKYRMWSYVASPRNTNAVMTTIFYGKVPPCGGGSGGNVVPAFDALIAHVDLDTDTNNDNLQDFQRQTDRTDGEDGAEGDSLGHVANAVKVLQNPGYEEGSDGEETARLQDYQVDGISVDDPDLVRVNMTVDGRDGHTSIAYGAAIRLYHLDGALIPSGTALTTPIGEYTYLMEGISPGQGRIQVEFVPDGGLNHAVDSVHYEVHRVIKLSYTTFIPFNHVLAPPSPGPDIFEGDDRSFDPTAEAYRTRQSIIVIPNQDLSPGGIKTGSEFMATGVTRGYDQSAIEDDGEITDADIPTEEGQADTSTMSLAIVSRVGDSIRIRFQGESPNPLVTGAPGIGWDAIIEIEERQDLSIGFRIDGMRDGFPSHESYADEHPLHQFAPADPGEVTSLFPPLDDHIFDFGTVP